jgi:IS30 family transposase
VDGIYHSIYAHKATEVRKGKSHKKYLLKTHPALKSYVIEKLELGWSPEQIAGRLREEITDGIRFPKEYISHESIYQYIYDLEQKELRLWERLPRSHKKRYRWLGRRSWSVKISHRVSIHKRSENINNRAEFGHWEGDTVVGLNHITGIHTEVERVSRLLFACHAFEPKKPIWHSLPFLALFQNKPADQPHWITAVSISYIRSCKQVLICEHISPIRIARGREEPMNIQMVY